jgi:hypothetical protein
MPIEHLVDHERRLVEVIFLGAVSRQEIEAFRLEVESLAPHALAYDALWASRGPRQYRVFRSLGEACGWLGLDRVGLCLEETAHG